MKRLPRTCLALLTMLATVYASAATTEKYPSRPVRIIVPYPPGGGSDLTGRTIGQKLAEALGQSFVVDNRPGATGLIGTQLAAKATPDGHTLLLADMPHSILPLVYGKPPYDAIKDFAPLNLLATSPQALSAHPSFSASTLKELLSMPRAQTAKLSLGTAGLASGPHMTYELLRVKTGLTLVHVPYKGGGPSLTDAVAGQIPLVINAMPAVIPHIKAGRLKGLAVTSPQRHPLLPAVQSFAEAGVRDLVAFQWYGLFATAGTPKPVVALLNREVNKTLAMPDVKERFTSVSLDLTPGSPEDFLKLLQAEDQRWKEVLKQVPIRLD